MTQQQDQAQTDPQVHLILKRYKKAADERSSWQSLWQDCYRYTVPEQAHFFGFSSVSMRQMRDHLYDATAGDAAEQLAASILGYLAPPWSNWLGIVPGGHVPEDRKKDLSAVLEQAAQTVLSRLDQSNFASELHQCLMDLVVGGTACLHVGASAPDSPIPFTLRAVPLYEAVMAADENGDLTSFYRLRDVTRDQMMELIPDHRKEDDVFKFVFDASDETVFQILEFSEKDKKGYQTGIILLSHNADPVMIYNVHAAHSPFIMFRWMKMAGESYGRSPVMKVLPDIKTANKVVELILKNASIAVTGIWQADDDGVLNIAAVDLVPGAIIPKAMGSAGLTPLQMPARFDVSQLVLDDLRARIRHAMLTDRFSQFDGRRMTATEVNERSDDIFMILSAVYGRLQSELLDPLVKVLYGLMRDRGDVPDLPLDGRYAQIVFRSPLARLQARKTLTPLLEWMDRAMQLPGDTAARLNTDALLDYAADIMGIPAHFIMPKTAIQNNENTDIHSH